MAYLTRKIFGLPLIFHDIWSYPAYDAVSQSIEIVRNNFEVHLDFQPNSQNRSKNQTVQK
ncbi:Uncharacterised protein [Leminorella grimontii]|nr:Uncharacterised protein [Leminorella grimontii]